jgi:hypothetical protein
LLALWTNSLSRLSEFRPEISNPFANVYLLDQFTLLEARTAMIGPAARRGVTFEPQLVEAILNDLQSSSGILAPHLSLVCFALYEELRTRRFDSELPPVITLDMYASRGRLGGILGRMIASVVQRYPLAKHILPMFFEESSGGHVPRTVGELIKMLRSEEKGRRVSRKSWLAGGKSWLAGVSGAQQDEDLYHNVRGTLEGLTMERILRAPYRGIDAEPIFELASGTVLSYFGKSVGE